MNSDLEKEKKFEAGNFDPSLQNTVNEVKKLKEKLEQMFSRDYTKKTNQNLNTYGYYQKAKLMEGKVTKNKYLKVTNLALLISQT